MMTSEQVVSILYRLVEASELGVSVSGGIYTAEDRPGDSRVEDITIGVPANRIAQYQRGTAYVNIYVPKIPKGSSLIRHRERIMDLEEKTYKLLEEVVTSDYHFKLVRQTVRDIPEIDQHCIINELSFTIVNY